MDLAQVSAGECALAALTHDFCRALGPELPKLHEIAQANYKKNGGPSDTLLKKYNCTRGQMEFCFAGDVQFALSQIINFSGSGVGGGGGGGRSFVDQLNLGVDGGIDSDTMQDVMDQADNDLDNEMNNELDQVNVAAPAAPAADPPRPPPPQHSSSDISSSSSESSSSSDISSSESSSSSDDDKDYKKKMKRKDYEKKMKRKWKQKQKKRKKRKRKKMKRKRRNDQSSDDDDSSDDSSDDEDDDMDKGKKKRNKGKGKKKSKGGKGKKNKKKNKKKYKKKKRSRKRKKMSDNDDNNDNVAAEPPKKRQRVGEMEQGRMKGSIVANETREFMGITCKCIVGAEKWTVAIFECPACGKTVRYHSFQQHWYVHGANGTTNDIGKDIVFNGGCICLENDCDAVFTSGSQWTAHIEKGCPGKPGKITGQRRFPRFAAQHKRADGT